MAIPGVSNQHGNTNAYLPQQSQDLDHHQSDLASRSTDFKITLRCSASGLVQHQICNLLVLIDVVRRIDAISIDCVVQKRLVGGPSPCDDTMVGELKKDDQKGDSACGKWEDDLEIAA